MITAPLAEVAQLIDRIVTLPELSVGAIEQLLSVQLSQRPTPPNTRLEYETTLAAGPFARVEMHRPGPHQARFELVSLDMREGTALGVDDFLRQDVISAAARMYIEPNGPPGGMLTYEVTRDSRVLVYEFNAETRLLRAVAVQRRAAIPVKP